MRAYHFFTLFALFTVHSWQNDYLPSLPQATASISSNQWVAFESNFKNGQVYLRWQTKLDKRPKGFEIERSRDGESYESVGKISGKTKNNKQQYRFRDVFPSPGKIYYRLRMVDAKGESSYSEIQALNNPTPEAKVFSLQNYETAFTVYFPAYTEGRTALRLLDSQGEVVHQEDLPEGLQSWGLLWDEAHTSESYLLQIVLKGKTYYQLIERKDS
ncbi:MAG: hypothetical protein AAFN10_24210 [Bacteroidota bacterium]